MTCQVGGTTTSRNMPSRTFKRHYNNSTITNNDIFYYTYGLLHHRGYRNKYQASLVRGLPHIPMAPDFKAFMKAGRRLTKLHLGYEDGPRHSLDKPLNPIPDSPKSIKFGKKPNAGAGPKSVPDLSTIYVDGIKVYNNLPDVRYAVNGRTPVQWFADRYTFRTHKKSGITNYPLEDREAARMCGQSLRGWFMLVSSRMKLLVNCRKSLRLPTGNQKRPVLTYTWIPAGRLRACYRVRYGMEPNCPARSKEGKGMTAVNPQAETGFVCWHVFFFLVLPDKSLCRRLVAGYTNTEGLTH